MERIIPKTDLEIVFSNKAIIACRELKETLDNETEILSHKKFHMGDIVIKRGTNILDAMFNTGDGNIGKIVGWDSKNEYYRVFYSKANPYIGVEEEKLDNFYGTVPFEVLSYDPYNVTMLTIRI